MKTVLGLACVFAVASAAGVNCNGKPNMLPIHADAPAYVTSVPNGHRFVTGPADLDPQLSVIHLYGSSYEMGVAYGQLMKEEITALVPQVMTYLDGQIEPYIKSLPADLQKLILKDGPEAALDFTMWATSEHIEQHYLDLIQGMGNGTDMDWKQLMRVSLLPELIKMSCSMFGAWGPATANTTSELVQLRALDWSTDGPFQQYPLVIVYHPDQGNTYSTLTWAGLVGSITGMSENGMGISEKVWLHYHGKYSPFGIPTTYLLEDIIRLDNDTDQALSRIASANRTASIFIGIGDRDNNQFRAVEYSHQTVNIYNDKNFPAYQDHDLFKSLVFVDKHTQPSHDPCLNSLLHEYYGSLSPVNTLRYITSQFQTGDMHIGIYDFANNLMFVSNASPNTNNATVVMAYDRPFIQLNMTMLFGQPRPSPAFSM